MTSVICLPAGLLIVILKVAFANTNTDISDQYVDTYKDCTSFILNDGTSCKSKFYYESVAIRRCVKKQQSSVVFQRSKACSDDMYLEVTAYCCPVETPSTKISGSERFQNQILNFAGENEDNDLKSAIISKNDNLLKEYLLNHSLTSNNSQEKDSYDTARNVITETYVLRHAALEEELKEAESHLSNEEWINHPDLTQNAEESIHSEFRQKFLTLDDDEAIDRQNVEHVYRDLIFKQIEKRNKAAIALWEQALKTSQPNATQLMKTAQHLLHVIERNRHASLMYHKQIMATSKDVSSGGRWLEQCRKSLSDLELLLLKNLFKLDKFPVLSESIRKQLEEYRHEKYGKLDEAIKTFLVMPALPGSKPSASKREQSLRNADLVIEKYRHRQSKEASSNSQDIGFPDGKTFEQPSLIKVDQVKTLSAIENIELPPNQQEQDGVGNAVTKDNPSHPLNNTGQQKDTQEKVPLKVHVLAYKTPSEPPPSVPKLQMTVIHQRDPQEKLSHVTTVNSYSPAAVIVTYVSMGILLPVVFLVTVRWCVRRYRKYRERAGYTLTTVEVDERQNRWPGEAPQRNGSANRQRQSAGNSRQSRLARWQSSGYVNPAYRHKEAEIPYFSQAVS